jgi:uncharacterized protein YdaU (DUF1376 family)
VKDPAFLFYPNDYIGGTMGMTFEEKGAYMELLMLQFNRGHMTGHMIGQVVGQIWVKIQSKFKVDVDGLFYNQRLDDEIKKRQEYVSSRLNNKEGINQYTNKKRSYDHAMTGHMTGHTVGHMENVNVNEDIDVNTTEKGSRGKQFIKPTLDEVTAYCNERHNTINPQEWLDHYESNGWKVGSNSMKDWKAAIRTWEKRSGQFQSKPVGKMAVTNKGSLDGFNYEPIPEEAT